MQQQKIPPVNINCYINSAARWEMFKNLQNVQTVIFLKYITEFLPLTLGSSCLPLSTFVLTHFHMSSAIAQTEKKCKIWYTNVVEERKIMLTYYMRRQSPPRCHPSIQAVLRFGRPHHHGTN